MMEKRPVTPGQATSPHLCSDAWGEATSLFSVQQWEALGDGLRASWCSGVRLGGLEGIY